MRKVPVLELIKKFNLNAVGRIGVDILKPSSLKKQSSDSLLWLKNKESLSLLDSGYVITNIKEDLNSYVKENLTFLVTDQNPRLVFAKIVNEYFAQDKTGFTNYAEHYRKNKTLIIGDNCFIAKDVEIGDGTIIYPNVVILENTKIGKDCVVQSHVSIGTEGLGLELDPVTNKFIKFPQVGGVIIGDGVDIGPNSTIRRSALDDTIIGNGSKLGALTNIGHNCIIGENCIFTCQIVTSGSSKIGNNVFMGVNSIVKNGVNIGNNVTIGQGAVVNKHVPDNTTFVGNPAIDIEEFKLWSKLKKKLIEKDKWMLQES